MNKTLKKILSGVIGLMTVFSSFSTAAPVLAESNSSNSFTITLPSGNTNEIYLLKSLPNSQNDYGTLFSIDGYQFDCRAVSSFDASFFPVRAGSTITVSNYPTSGFELGLSIRLIQDGELEDEGIPVPAEYLNDLFREISNTNYSSKASMYPDLNEAYFNSYKNYCKQFENKGEDIMSTSTNGVIPSTPYYIESLPQNSYSFVKDEPYYVTARIVSNDAAYHIGAFDDLSIATSVKLNGQLLYEQEYSSQFIFVKNGDVIQIQYSSSDVQNKLNTSGIVNSFYINDAVYANSTDSAMFSFFDGFYGYSPYTPVMNDRYSQISHNASLGDSFVSHLSNTVTGGNTVIRTFPAIGITSLTPSNIDSTLTITAESSYDVDPTRTQRGYAKDSGASMQFAVVSEGSDPYDSFTSLEIDGNTVDPSNYTTTRGSLVLNLNADYMQTLSNGSHTATFNFGTTSTSTNFRVGSTGSDVGNYTTVNGDGVSLSLNKYLMLRSDATVPETTVNFAIAPGTAIAAGNGKFEVLAGVGVPSVSSISFSAADTKQNSVASGDTITLDSGMSYVKKSVFVDFSSVTFDEPGVYRYVLTEACNDEATFMDMDVQKMSGATAKTRILDVYVTDNNGILHELLGDIAAGADMGTDVAARLSDKSDGYVNQVVTYNLEAGNETVGNQGSKDKYFKYTLALTGLQANHTYQVDLSNAAEQSGANAATIADNTNKTNPATITTDENGAATVNYYLNDGQYVKVLGLTRNSAYAITADAEDYKRTAGTDAQVSENKVHDDPVSGEFATLEADQYTGYTMTKSGVVPTGVFAGAAGAIALIGFAFVLLMGKKRTAYDD